jgi:hypothetical protein
MTTKSKRPSPMAEAQASIARRSEALRNGGVGLVVVRCGACKCPIATTAEDRRKGEPDVLMEFPDDAGGWTCVDCIAPSVVTPVAVPTPIAIAVDPRTRVVELETAIRERDKLIRILRKNNAAYAKDNERLLTERIDYLARAERREAKRLNRHRRENAQERGVASGGVE